jgi:hypothetical protein
MMVSPGFGGIGRSILSMPRARSTMAATMGAGCDGSLGGVVAEVDIDDADRFERRQASLAKKCPP